MAGDRIPGEPLDVFTQLTPVLDQARATIAGIGLRTYRTFLLTREYEGPRALQGAIVNVTWDELVPAPKVIHLSAGRIMASAGKYQDGAVELQKITRSRRREALLGKTIAGDNLPEKSKFFYALVPRGQLFAELYVPASDAILRALSWSLVLNPARERVPAPFADVPQSAT